MFYVGQKVVCVDDVPVQLRVGDPTFPLRSGEVYTVRGFADQRGDKCILLCEIFEPELADLGYFARRFRPAVERKTSIEIFTRMLNPSKERETA